MIPSQMHKYIATLHLNIYSGALLMTVAIHILNGFETLTQYIIYIYIPTQI